jgi:hypothetical protein
MFVSVSCLSGAGGMTTVVLRIRFPHARKPEPTPISEPMEPIIQDELGGWSVWHDSERFPSRTFAAAIAAKQERRHECDQY